MRDTIEILSYKGTESPHKHLHTQIVLPLSGSLILDVDDCQQSITFGQACLISSHQPHSHMAEENNQCLVINDIPGWDNQLPSKTTYVELSPQAKAYLPFLSSLTQTQHNSRLKEQALNIVEHLLPLPIEQLFKSDLRLEKAKRLLEKSFHEPWSMSELARQIHLSQSQLTVLFKRSLGITPKQYLLKCRMEATKHWLEMSNLPLDDIAQKIGILDATALIRNFTKQYGITPGEYRKRA